MEFGLLCKLRQRGAPLTVECALVYCKLAATCARMVH